MIETFVVEFPKYIEIASTMKAFENLKVQKNRYSFGTFSDDLQKFYDRRIEDFKRRIFLKSWNYKMTKKTHNIYLASSYSGLKFKMRRVGSPTDHLL